MSLTVASLLCLLAVGFYILYRRGGPSSRRLPPGPKPLPILGNVNDFPSPGSLEYEHWLNHKDLYGGISSVTAVGQTLVIIHDKNIARKLLEQMSSKTSDRPTMVMANELCGFGSIVLCQNYTPNFRRCRKYLHQELGTISSASRFRDTIRVEVGHQLGRVLRRPEALLQHFKTTAATTVLKMAYGYAVEPDKPDILVDLVDTLLAEFSEAAVPMAWAVDMFPFLRHLPPNFPGAGFQKTAQRYRRHVQMTAYVPFRFVERQVRASTNSQSYVSRLVEELKDVDSGSLHDENKEAIIWSAASLYGAASDTTVITLTAFVLAMTKYEHVQHKAQEEIDRVVGKGRLPNFDDRPNLPYVDALVKEASRWWPVTPMGFPHTATEDIVCDGFYIPKNSTILPAQWWFLNDPGVYADPRSFDPGRFLAPRNEPDPDAVFGFGRRVCPGRFFADLSLFLNIAQMLAVFKMTKPKAPDGSPVEVEVKPKPGILTYPSEFAFHLEPRSERHAVMIRETESKYPLASGDGHELGNLEDFETKY